jgi:predicted ATPase/DNA-binding SARP family transcriptional activator
MSQQGIELRILGPFEMAAGGSPVRFGSLKQRMLMAHLTARANRPVPVGQLVFALWGEAPPATVDTTLRSLVSRLRRLLASIPPPESGSAPRVVGQDCAYLLQVDAGWIDAVRFEEDVTAGRRALDAGDPLEAVRCFQAGLARWRGPALPELADVDALRAEATRLNEDHVAAMEALADAELAAGQPALAQATLESVVAEHPLREPAWGRLMLALYRQGRQADALRVYQRARRLLVDQLGVEPGPGLRKLEQQVLAQSSELEGPGGSRHNTVAFLFTDIEASTRRWEGDRQAMASDLACHDELLRAEVDKVGGRVFSHTGDGLCASFPTAAGAVAAAVAGQRALQRQRWESAEPLRVRMAVHAGAAEARGDNWVGPPLNRAARLMALAGGGQVLCSRAAADLAGDDLPPGVRLADLGEHRLADLARAEQVFGVEHPDLVGGCSVLASSGGRRTNLREAVTSFLGRSQDLDELETLLASARILTLTGIGGAGKTRLATEVARRCINRYPDGVWLVELASVRDGALVAEEVGHALGLVGGRERGLDSLREWLAARRLLLVLDNCEHLVEEVAALLEAVLPAAPGLSVLATSREVLALPGEVSWTVPPLSLPPATVDTAAELSSSDAVDLFCHRARSAQPAFALSDANAAAVAQICRRLDGIPLALELAAARIRVLGADQLAERLDDRFRVLAPTSRGATRRHHTLQATMDWSWELLPSRERTALARLSVFPADFDLDAAEAVVVHGGRDESTADGSDLVLRLVDKSLVAAVTDGPEMRYRLLETVRSYAAGKLAEVGDEDAARRAHCEHFLRRAERPAEEYWALDRLFTSVAADEASFRAAIEWCLATGRRDEALRLMATYWLYAYLSNPSSGGLLLARCVAHPRPTPSPALVECLRALTLLPEGRRDATYGVEATLREALDMARGLGDTAGENRVQLYLGSVLVNQGRFDEGRAVLVAARDYFAAQGERVAQSWVEHELGWECLFRGDHAGARACFEAGLVCAGEGRSSDDAIDRVSAATLWSDRATLGAVDGNEDQARQDAVRAVATARQLPIGGVLLMALCRAADVGILIDDDVMATESLAELLVTLRDLGDWHWAPGALEGTVCLLVPRDAEEGAIETRLLAAAEEIRRKLGEGAPNAAVADRLTKRRAEIAALLGPKGLATETDRGRQASSDEALRWALALLRNSLPLRGHGERV